MFFLLSVHSLNILTAYTIQRRAARCEDLLQNNQKMSSNGKMKKKSGAYYRKRQKYIQMYNNFDLHSSSQSVQISTPVYRCDATLSG